MSGHMGLPTVECADKDRRAALAGEYLAGEVRRITIDLEHRPKSPDEMASMRAKAIMDLRAAVRRFDAEKRQGGLK